MGITLTLKAAARSAYRNLYRAASAAFAGDEPVLTAFRQKMRDDAVRAQAVTSTEEYQQHIQLARDAAVFLRRNIIQGVKVAEDDQEDGGTWHLRIHNETELGDNESIKNSKPMESSRSARKRRTCADPNAVLPEQPRLNYSALKKASQKRVVPEVHDEDLEESFTRGSGPGGQSINKTENNVQLLHKPTGIRVTCQETRALAQNRKIARKLLVEKACQLSFIPRSNTNGLSKEEMKRARQIERERRRRKKAKKRNAAREEDDV